MKIDRNSKTQLDKDIKFLKEMKKCSEEMVSGFNLTLMQRVNNMIEDWKNELEGLQPEVKE